MSRETEALWERATMAIEVAKHDLLIDPNSAASRAYYSAFYAASALLVLHGKTFKKHSAVESAVHAQLVKTGLWPKERGEDYSLLMELRGTSDYGGVINVSNEEAVEAIEAARRILESVHRENREMFPLDR
ncbi:MAG: HEPN domain-containing protein [Nitrospinae bacterium]|nr:HEPN domain-containing protein [Nitrospinota bacterium]